MLKNDDDEGILRQVVDAWYKEAGTLPSDYFCFDLETSGFAFNFRKSGGELECGSDLVWELGHCDVTDGEADAYEWTVINWFGHPFVEDEFVAYKVEACAKSMAAAGRQSQMTVARMRDEGIPPEEAFEKYRALLTKARDEGKYFAGHNIIRFDARVFDDAIAEFTGEGFEMRPEELFDTAAVVKSLLAGMPPLSDEKLCEYMNRVLNTPIRGVKYNMGFCIDRYKLVERYELDTKDSHSAGFDSLCVHLIIEELKEIIR